MMNSEASGSQASGVSLLPPVDVERSKRSSTGGTLVSQRRVSAESALMVTARSARRGSLVTEKQTRADFQKRFLKELAEARGAGAATESMFKLILDRMGSVEDQLLLITAVNEDDLPLRRIAEVSEKTDVAMQKTEQAMQKTDLAGEELVRLRDRINKLEQKLEHQQLEMANLAHNVAGDTDDEEGNSLYGGRRRSTIYTSGEGSPARQRPLSPFDGPEAVAVGGSSAPAPPPRQEETTTDEEEGGGKDERRSSQWPTVFQLGREAAITNEISQVQTAMSSMEQMLQKMQASHDDEMKRMKEQFEAELEAKAKDAENTAIKLSQDANQKALEKSKQEQEELVEKAKKDQQRLMQQQLMAVQRAHEEEMKERANANKELEDQIIQDLSMMKALKEKIADLDAREQRSETEEAELREDLKVMSNRLANIQTEVKESLQSSPAPFAASSASGRKSSASRRKSSVSPIATGKKGKSEREERRKSSKSAKSVDTFKEEERRRSSGKTPPASQRPSSANVRPKSSKPRKVSTPKKQRHSSVTIDEHKELEERHQTVDNIVGVQQDLEESRKSDFSKISLPSFRSESLSEDGSARQAEEESNPNAHRLARSQTEMIPTEGKLSADLLKKSNSDQSGVPLDKPGKTKELTSLHKLANSGFFPTNKADITQKLDPLKINMISPRDEHGTPEQYGGKKPWKSDRRRASTTSGQEASNRPLSAFAPGKWGKLKKNVIKPKKINGGSLNGMGWEKALADLGKPITEVKLKKSQTVSSRLNRIEHMLDEYGRILSSEKFQKMLNEGPKVVYQVMNQPRKTQTPKTSRRDSRRDKEKEDDAPPVPKKSSLRNLDSSGISTPQLSMKSLPIDENTVVSKLSSKLPRGVIDNDDESSLNSASSILYNVPQTIQELAVTPTELSFALSCHMENIFRQAFDCITINSSMMTNDLWLHNAITEAITHLHAAITCLEGRTDKIPEAQQLIEALQRLAQKLSHLDETLVNKDLLNSIDHPEIWIRFQAQAVDVGQALHNLVIEETKFTQELRNLSWNLNVTNDEEAHFYSFPQLDPKDEPEEKPSPKVVMTLRAGLVMLLNHISVVLMSRQKDSVSHEMMSGGHSKRLSSLKAGLNNLQWEKAVEIQEREMIKMRERVELTTAEYERMKSNQKKVVEALKKVLEDKEALNNATKTVLDRAAEMQENLEKRMDTLVTLLEMKAGWKDVKSVKGDIEEVKDCLFQLRSAMPAKKVWNDLNRRLRTKADKNDIIKLLKSWEETEGNLRVNSTLAGGPSVSTRCLSCDQPVSLAEMEKDMVEQVAQEIHARIMAQFTKSPGGIPELGTVFSQPGILVQHDSQAGDPVNPKFGSATLERMRPHTSPIGQYIYRGSQSAHGSRRPSTSHLVKPGPLGNARMSSPDILGTKHKKKKLGKRIVKDGIRFGQGGEQPFVDTLFANLSEGSVTSPEAVATTPQHMKVKLPKGEALILDNESNNNNLEGFFPEQEPYSPDLRNVNQKTLESDLQHLEQKTALLNELAGTQIRPQSASPSMLTEKQKNVQKRMKVPQKGYKKR